jgi:carbonic anhydrase
MHASLVTCVVGCILFQLTSAADWGYDDHGHDSHSSGPSEWKKSNPACGGHRQSPIDINPTSTAFSDSIGKFKFIGYDRTSENYTFLLHNNGHTVQLDIKSGDIWIKGAALPDTYKLVQIHVHWGATNNYGSEHTINKKTFPVEIHFVHFNNRKYSNVSAAADKPGGLAVIGVFGQVDKVAFPNEALQNIIDKFTSVRYAHDHTTIEPFELGGLLPSEPNDFYRYQGSLTTPPCYESVIWTVLKNPLKISPIQLNAFRTLSHNANSMPDSQLADNYRPTQPLGSRTVYRSFVIPTPPPPPPKVAAVVMKCTASGWLRPAPISVLVTGVMATVLARKLSHGGLV